MLAVYTILSSKLVPGREMGLSFAVQSPDGKASTLVVFENTPETRQIHTGRQVNLETAGEVSRAFGCPGAT
jgi:hypothetical protein